MMATIFLTTGVAQPVLLKMDGTRLRSFRLHGNGYRYGGETCGDATVLNTSSGSLVGYYGETITILMTSAPT